MSYTDRSGERELPKMPDMPAVSPLDMPAGVEQQQQQAARRRISPKSPRQVLQPETAPPPPPRSQKARHPLVVVLNFFVMIVVLLVGAGGAAFYFGSQRFTQPGPLTGQTTVLIQPGADLDAIATQLERYNVIDSPLVFTTTVRFIYHAEDKLKAGEYLFQPNASMKQVVQDLLSGRSVLHAITIPEGLTSKAIVDRLNADDTLTGSIASVPPEGALMPETYRFTRGATRQQMLDQMQSAQTRLVQDVWSRREAGLPISTPEELVTLASIVEKETGRADERPRVASVFINRLREGMRLQSDPTVLYGLFGGAGRPADRPIYQSDLDKPTPYNTYLVAGLPPTPIANPGRAALEAVANPSRTNDLFFVADGTGGHVFAATLEDHNRNVARWRQIKQQSQNRAPAADGKATPAPAGEATANAPGGQDASPDAGADAGAAPADAGAGDTD